jgi:hypothetical protein
MGSTVIILFLKKEVARGGEQTRVLSISFIFSFSPLYRRATAAPPMLSFLWDFALLGYNVTDYLHYFIPNFTLGDPILSLGLGSIF